MEWSGKEWKGKDGNGLERKGLERKGMVKNKESSHNQDCANLFIFIITLKY
jgi:hypothetical protein